MAAFKGKAPGSGSGEMSRRTVLLRPQIGLTPAQTFDAIGLFDGMGGIGPRLYNCLIGRAAVVQGLRTIVTWNVRDMHCLFPGLRVATPADAMVEG